MAMSHQGPLKPYHSVTLLLLEPGGSSPMPSRARAWAIMPLTDPISEVHVFRQGVEVARDDGVWILAHAALIRIDVQHAGTTLGLDRGGLEQGGLPDGEAGQTRNSGHCHRGRAAGDEAESGPPCER